MSSPTPFHPEARPPGPAGSPHSEEGEDLFRYPRVILDRWWVVLGTLLLGAALFAYWAGKQPVTYTASAYVLVTPPPMVLGEVRGVDETNASVLSALEYLPTQIKVLTSDTLARRVVNKLSLDKEPTFWLEEQPENVDAAAFFFLESVTANVVPDTQILQVSFEHHNAEQAKRAVDALVDAFVLSRIEAHGSVNASASTWLAQQADKMRLNLIDAEHKLFDFKRQNDLLSVSFEDRISLAATRMNKLSEALTEVRLRRAAREAELQAVVKLGGGSHVTVGIGAPDTFSGLKNNLIEEERRLGELIARYEEAHPLVRQQRAKLEVVRSALSREAGDSLRGTRVRAETTAEEERRVFAQLEEAKLEGLRVGRLEVEYRNLKREADFLAKEYQIVAGRTKETELSSKLKVNNMEVLDYARVPDPNGINWSRAGTGWLGGSLLLGLLLAFGLESLDRTIKDQHDIDKKLRVPCLGVIPKINTHNDLIVFDEPNSLAAECCRLIRTYILFSGVSTPQRKLLITSSVPREGKTLTSISLATVMAAAGTRVLLIDCDLRRPRIRTALGLTQDFGVTSVVLGTKTLDEAILPTKIPNLFVLLAGPVPPNPAEFISGPRFPAILDECAERFDRVIMDSSPAGPVADAAILSAYCDAVILVLRSGLSNYVHTRRVQKRLQNASSAVLLGVVLNDFSVTRERYQYGYGGYGVVYRGQGGEGPPKAPPPAEEVN